MIIAKLIRRLADKNLMFLFFLNAVFFWLSFTALRIFLIFANGFNHSLGLAGGLAVLFYGLIEDLIFVLPFFFALVLVSLAIGPRGLNLVGFKFWYVFICAFELLFLFAYFVDILFFSLAGSHAHLWTFNYLFQLKYFFSSIGGFLSFYSLLVFGLLFLLFIVVNYCLVVSLKNAGRFKPKLLGLFFSFILFLILNQTNQALVINDVLAEDLSNNLFVYIASTKDYYHCVAEAVTGNASGLQSAVFNNPLLRPESLPGGEVYLDDQYPLVKASPHVFCALNKEQAECRLDNDQDGYLLVQDCDDTNPQIHPGAFDQLNNGVDENCNGLDDAKPNVILIVLESFGAEYTQLNESADPEITPNFNSLLGQSLNFKNFYSNGVDTISSIASSLCSVYPYPDPASNEIYESGLDLLCLPNILQQFGYQTLEMQAGDLDFLNKPALFKKLGFQQFSGKKQFGNQDENKWGITDRQLFSEITKKLDQPADQPFFLTVYSLAVHHPFDLPEDDIVQQYVQDDFGNKILNLLHYTDQALGEFFEQNKNKDWFKNSIVLITADNGQPLGQRRIFNKGNFNHVFEENVWVPLVILGRPDLNGQRDTISSHIDITPTILDLLGIDVLNHFIGQSLIKPNLAYADSFVYSMSKFGKCMMALRQGDYKFISDLRQTYQFFYNLNSDRDEKHDLSGSMTDQLAGFKDKVFQTYLGTMHLFLQNRFWSSHYQQLMEQAIKN